MTEDFATEVSGIGSLADPVRRALYLHVVGAHEPVSRDQAATATGVARHTAKFHLDRLVDEGLLETEYRRLSGRRGPGAGRPSKLYRRASREFAVSLPERRYDLAGQILAQALEDAASRSTTVEEAVAVAASEAGRRLAEESVGARGTRWGGEVSHGEGEGRRGDLVEVLRACGYEPRLTSDGRRDVVELANCPFHSLARNHTQLVCGMNLSMLGSLTKGLGRGDDVEVRLDPAPGRCCVTLTRRQ
ncbi:MAG: helix-turn-helix transcriptional regulator [Actinomycetes bacterium]